MTMSEESDYTEYRWEAREKWDTGDGIAILLTRSVDDRKEERRLT